MLGSISNTRATAQIASPSSSDTTHMISSSGSVLPTEDSAMSFEKVRPIYDTDDQARDNRFIVPVAPPARGYTTPIRPPRRCDRARDARFRRHITASAAGRRDRRWCFRASRSSCWQANGTSILRTSACGGLSTSSVLFIRGGEGAPRTYWWRIDANP